MNTLSASLPALRLHFGHFASSWFGLPDRLERPGEPARDPTHTLHAQELMWLDGTRHLQVACLDGCVLLQYQGRPLADVILVRGESHGCEPGARVAIQAFVASALHIA